MAGLALTRMALNRPPQMQQMGLQQYFSSTVSLSVFFPFSAPLGQLSPFQASPLQSGLSLSASTTY
jgi:hypothetical protein